MGHKPESICSELHHVILFPHMAFLCLRPCPRTFSSIVGLIWQDFFVVVHVVLLAESPNRLNGLEIPSIVQRSSRRADPGIEHSKKRYTEVEYVAIKMKYFIMSYNSGFCLINVWALAVYFANAPSQLFWEGKLGKPKEEIGYLNGFEYTHFCDLKMPYFFVLVLRIHKSYFHGHNTLPLHGKTCSAIDEQTETGPKKTPPTAHSNVRWRKKDQW